MISEIKRTYNPGAIYLVNGDITRCHISDNPINGKTLHIGTPVVYIQTIQQTDCIVRDYTGQVWRLSRGKLDKAQISNIACKRTIFLYKTLRNIPTLGCIGTGSFLFLALASYFCCFPVALTLTMFLAFVICFAITAISIHTDERLSETGKYHLYTNYENLRELEVLLNNSSLKK